MLIQSDTELRQYIPNTLVTVQGETSLYDKLQPDLWLSEMWLDHLVGTTDIQPDLARSLIATDAFLRAIPSLDLVLTPNGFGIVSNSNIVPASKERVDRLILSLEHKRDYTLDQLLRLLLQDAAWRTTPQAAYFLQTLFQTPFALPANLRQNHAFDVFQQTHAQFVLIETEFADKYISAPVYDRLRQDPDNPAFANLVAPLQAIEVEMLSGKPLPYRQLITLVEYIRTHEEVFPEWQTSTTAKLYQSHYFQNRKDSSGYWW